MAGTQRDRARSREPTYLIWMILLSRDSSFYFESEELIIQNRERNKDSRSHEKNNEAKKMECHAAA